MKLFKAKAYALSFVLSHMDSHSLYRQLEWAFSGLLFASSFLMTGGINLIDRHLTHQSSFKEGLFGEVRGHQKVSNNLMA